MTNKIVISAKNVGVAYRRLSGLFKHEKYWALKDITLDVYKGETLGILGKNGVGKSTLLKILAGIIRPDKGSVINYGVSASLLSLQAGFVQYLTGKENAILGGMMLGLTKKEITQKIEEIYEYSDIGDFFYQPVRSYSSGMRARLGFSVAIYANPDVILLDEVLGVGDSDFRIKSTKTMKQIVRSEKTIIIVSHQPALIKELCDRVVLISNGVIENVVAPSEIL